MSTIEAQDLGEYVAELQTLKITDVETKALQLAKHGAYTFATAFILSAKTIPLNVAHMGNSKAAIVAAAIAAGHVTLDALAPAAIAAVVSLRNTAEWRLAAARAARAAKKVAKAKAVLAAAAETPAA